MMGLFLNQNLDIDDKQEGVQKAMGDYVYKFWHLLDETLNAILFILIGLEIIVIFESFQTTTPTPMTTMMVSPTPWITVR